MSYQQFSTPGWAALTLVIAACGSAPLSQVKLNEAQTAMHDAETLGAANDPQAKQSLQQARDLADQAKRLAAKGDGEEANLLLDRAAADADLASQLMRAHAEADKARAAWAKSKALGEAAQAPQ